MTIFCCALFCLLHVSCTDTDSNNPEKPTTNAAEMVVYGKIYTAENSSIAEALAVKDGKFVYVGDKEGKFADFVLIDQDMLTCFPMNIYNTNVTATFFDDKQVYEKEDEE